MAGVVQRFLPQGRFLALAVVATVACDSNPPSSAVGSHRFLAVWAGPHNGDSASAGGHDFLAVIDADTSSPTYGAVLTSVGAGVPGAMAHHTEFALPVQHALFASDYLTGQIFLVDLADPLAPRVTHRIDSVPGFRRPHSFARLPNGNVLASLQFGDGSLSGDPGGLAEFTPTGQLLRTASAADSSFPGARIRTYGLEVLPAIDRVVTTSTPMDTERTADVIQIWQLSNLHLLKTLAVPPFPGDSVHFYPFEVRALPDGHSALLNTYYCGFYLLTALETNAPRIELVHAMREPRRIGCSVPVVAGRFFVVPIAYDHSIRSLDLTDPSHPTEVASLRADSTVLPHWAAADPTSDRLVITGQDDGEARVLIARFNRATGALSWDERFRDSASSRLGLSFSQQQWPHGAVDHVMPHAALFGPARR